MPRPASPGRTCPDEVLYPVGDGSTSSRFTGILARPNHVVNHAASQTDGALRDPDAQSPAGGV